MKGKTGETQAQLEMDSLFKLPRSYAMRLPQAYLEGEDIPFTIVSKLADWQHEGNTFILKCKAGAFVNKSYRSHETVLRKLEETDEYRGGMTFRIDFRTPGIFRVRFNEGEEAMESFEPPDSSAAMLTGCPRETVPVEAEEDEHCLRFITEEVILEAVKSPFRLIARERSGKVFWSQRVGEEIQKYTCDSFKTAAAGREGCRVLYESLDLGGEEHIYGLGERFDAVERRGRIVDFWNKDACGTTTSRTYINIPFIWSTGGYGLFLNAYGAVQWEIGSREAGTLLFGAESEVLDYFVIHGPHPHKIIKGYCGLTGFPSMPPVWTFGLWMSRNSYLSWDIVHEVVSRLQKEGIPADALHLDSAWFREDLNCDLKFDKIRFPEPEKHMALLKAQGLHISLWQWNYVVPDEDNENYVEGRVNKYFAKNGKGEIYQLPEDVKGVWTDHAVIDFSNPDAVSWYTNKIKALVKMGAEAIKTDFGEGIPADAVYENIEGKNFHNYYSLLYNHKIYNAIKGENKDAIVWARSGTAGSQRYPIHWAGDSQCSWSGLAGTLRGILSAGLSGIAFISHDIGGFIGRPETELYIRWAQLGLFSSHSRCHGMGDENPREPWSFGTEALDIFRKFAGLRYRLLPYIAAQARKCTQTGIPVVRALVLDYPGDRNVHYIDNQYLFGEDMLIAPILEPMSSQTVRTLYLPKGLWVDFWSGHTYDSAGQWIETAVTLDTMPIFVKGTAVLPYGEERLSTGNRVGPIAGLEIYPFAEGEWSHADGENSLTVSISSDTIKLREGNGAGTLELNGFPSRKMKVIILNLLEGKVYEKKSESNIIPADNKFTGGDVSR